MATITSNAVTGNWSAGSSWVGGVVPGAGDAAVIANGAIITVDVNTTVGSKASGVGHAVRINGASAGSFGTLQVASGVTLTLRGVDATSNTLMLINRYGLLRAQPGSTVLGDVPSDFGSCIINNGRFEAIGTSPGVPGRITFSVPAANVNWGSVSDTNTKVTSEAKIPTTYETGTNVAVAAFGNPLLSNAARTGLGSFGDTSLVINSSTPSLTTEVASLALVNGAGKYWIDYECGVIYLYSTTFTGLSVNTTYWKLDKVAADWRGWGIVSYGANSGNTCLLNYCDFSYMGASTAAGKTVNAVAASSPLVWMGHQSAGAAGNSTRLAYLKNSTIRFGFKHLQLNNCTGSPGDPLMIQGNTLGDCSLAGGGLPDGINFYTSSTSYITIDSNTINTRGQAIDLSLITADCAGVSITNNTGATGLAFVTGGAIGGAITPFPRRNDYQLTPRPSSPDLYIGNNSVRGFSGSGLDGRFLVISGTSGHPAIVENNWFHHCVRFGHLSGSYTTYRNNRMGIAYHHGWTGTNLDDLYSTDILFDNNLFYCDRGSVGSNSTSAAVQAGYNHRCTVNNLQVINNTVDGFLYGALDFGDIPDANGTVLLTNAVITNNIIANGKYAFGRYSSATQPNSLHVLECDYNAVYGQSTGFAGGTNGLTGSKCTGFYQGSNKYNRLTGAGRNINGVALFDPSYTTAQAGRSLVYTVNSLGTNHTLSWDGATPVACIYDSGTSSGKGYRTLGCTGKSTWTSNINSIRTKWLWIVSGTGAGQARAIVHVTANTAVAASVATGGTGYAVGDHMQITSGGTFDFGGSTGYFVYFRVAAVSGGAVTAVDIVCGGTLTTTPANPVTPVRIDGAGSGATFNITWAPGLMVATDFTTQVDSTSVFAIHESYLQLTDSSTGTVHAGFYLPDPANWQNTVQIPRTTQTDTGITVTVNKSPTGNPNFACAGLSNVATDYQWSAGSPCQDAGTSDNAPSTDYFGTSRPQGAANDIGFYELIAATGGFRLVGSGLVGGGLIL